MKSSTWQSWRPFGSHSKAFELLGETHIDAQKRTEIAEMCNEIAQGANSHDCGFLLRWLDEAKSKGQLRSEGKDYVVAEGDVMEFLFNV